MHFPSLSEESIRLSLVLKAFSISSPVSKLRQIPVKSLSEIDEILKTNKAETRIFAGSLAEGLLMKAGDQYDQLSSSDLDLVVIHNRYKIYEHFEELKRGKSLYPKLYHVLRQPDDTCPGYAQLLFLNERFYQKHTSIQYQVKGYLGNNLKELFRNNIMERFGDNLDIHGPAVSTNESNSPKRLEIARNVSYLNATDVEDKYKSVIDDTDHVDCLMGAKWPDEASEWTKRPRFCNWPTKELINAIIESGYILAGVGSKESNHSHIQWRLSFNRAELLLIESFNETQIHCIWLLKSLKAKLSKVAGKNITSYTMKTLMFWCVEEKPKKFWQSLNLVCCFCFCLSKLKTFVQKEFLPNYFIKERNQFIASEFTRSMQTETISCLDHFLENPIGSISSLLPKCKMLGHFELPKLVLEEKSRQLFFEAWMGSRKRMALDFRINDVTVFASYRQYDGYNIENSFLRCKLHAEKLSTVDYAQPFVKSLQNCMAVLKYVLLKKEKEKLGHTTDSDIKKQCLKYMKLSLKGDKTNTRLRIATCYLDNNVTEKCKILNIIRKVTDQRCIDYLLQNFKNLVEETSNDIIKTLKNMPHDRNAFETQIYNIVITLDLINKDPYRTLRLFKQLRKKGLVVGGYHLFRVLWRDCWLDVTFMPAELPILPKPAALELCMDGSQKKVTFNSIFYGLLLEFLWHVQNDSDSIDRENVVQKMMKNLLKIPEGQQSTGLNFLTYCCSLQQDYYSATRCLIQSFELNPVETNVAYLYIKYIINLLRTLKL